MLSSGYLPTHLVFMVCTVAVTSRLGLLSRAQPLSFQHLPESVSATASTAANGLCLHLSPARLCRLLSCHNSLSSRGALEADSVVPGVPSMMGFMLIRSLGHQRSVREARGFLVRHHESVKKRTLPGNPGSHLVGKPTLSGVPS